MISIRPRSSPLKTNARFVFRIADVFDCGKAGPANGQSGLRGHSENYEIIRLRTA
jgi:hypothetical protein